LNSKKALLFLFFFLNTLTVNGCRAHHQSPKSADSELVDAAERGKKASVLKALKRGANIEAKDQQGRTAIEWAGYRGDARVVAVLLDSGAKRKNPALLQAASSGPRQR
jgi:ankyrin repeat protein